MLFPLPKARFLCLNLLCESLTQSFLLFLELRVVKFLDLRLTKLAGLHLLLTVVLVVQLLGCRDEVEHMCTDKEGTKLAEVAMVLVFN